jgi:hypothetical protein
MTWKENWVFPALDPKAGVASLFHFSLRPGRGEGIFTAKFSIEGEEHRYVGRSPIADDLTTMRPIENERLRFEVVEPEHAFALRYRSPELDADVMYIARWPAFDFLDGPLAPGESILGDLGRAVFHFHHYEQALTHEGRIVVKTGPRAGETIEISGYANRDHSWGWRTEFSFDHHHWMCASFSDLFVGASLCQDDYYSGGPKSGGWLASDAGQDPIVAVDVTEGYPLVRDEPMTHLAADVRYRVRTVSGRETGVIAHLGSDYGRLYLDARSRDRSKTYQDVQIFCEMTREDNGERGTGVLEIGQRGVGDGIADSWRRTASLR